MNFYEIACNRQSCRKYDAQKPIEQEKLTAILESARLAPSACNGQPYHFTVCRGENAKAVTKATMGMGRNKFAADAPVSLVISEKPYVKTAAVGAKLMKNDYRSIDIGIAAATAAVILLIPKLWDAANDVLFGYIIDRYSFKSGQKFIPWVRIGTAAIGIYFTSTGGDPFIGPAPTGIIGMIPFIIATTPMVIYLKKAEKGTA